MENPLKKIPCIMLAIEEHARVMGQTQEDVVRDLIRGDIRLIHMFSSELECTIVFNSPLGL